MDFDSEEEDDEIVCPECGSDDCEDDGSGYLQYSCNDCGHTWGDDEDEDNDVDENDYAEEDDELHTFFPILDITLGETTVEDIEDEEYLYSEIEYRKSGLVIAWSKNSDGRKGAQIRKESDEDEFSNIYIPRHADMFEEWEDLGFDWNLSYKEWIQLFENRGYDIQIITRPHKKYHDSWDYWYFNAKFRAISPDYTIYFELDFSYGENRTKENSKGTLYALRAANSIERIDT